MAGAEPGRRVAAVDIGGTKTVLGLIEPVSGCILTRDRFPTPARDATGADFLDQIGRRVRAMVAAGGEPAPAALGVGLCELVGTDGTVDSAHRVDWLGLEPARRLAAATGLEVTLDSDVRAAALAEVRLGAGRPYREHLYLNIGTGIAAVWVRDGVPHRGVNGHGLVIASGPVHHRCPACGTIGVEVVEEVAGGAGMVRRLSAAAGRPVSGMAELLSLAGSREERALRVIEDAVRALAGTLGPVLGLLDPAALILGGGIGALPGPYRTRLIAELRTQVWSPRTRELPILAAALGADSGLIGAALAADDRS